MLPKDEHGNVVDRDGKRSAALNWSRGLTYAVLTVRHGYGVPVPPEQLPEMWWILFPLSRRGRGGLWQQLQMLHDGWFARTFHPASHADLALAVEGDASVEYSGSLRGAASDTRAQVEAALDADSRRLRRSSTLQLGLLLGWDASIPSWPPRGLDPTRPAALSPPASYDEKALHRLIAQFRRIGASYASREKDDAYYTARAWGHQRSRNEQKVKDLEARINDAGVLVEWSPEANTGPVFRPANCDGPAVQTVEVRYTCAEP